MHRLYLSRHNLETLLNKLNSGSCQAAILKNDTTHRLYPTSVPTLIVALENDVYYIGGAAPPTVTAVSEVADAPAVTKPKGPIKIAARRKKED